jgi:hypothetical protein
MTEQTSGTDIEDDPDALRKMRAAWKQKRANEPKAAKESEAKARKDREHTLRATVDGRSLKATGRTEQFNFKCREGTKRMATEAAKARGMTIAEWMEHAVAARYGFKSSDNDTDGYVWAFFYRAISFGGLFGHAVAVRLWRESKLAGFLAGVAAAAALTVSLSNSLGAMAGRGNEAQAQRIKIADEARGLNRSLKRKENEREAIKFTSIDEDAFNAAKRASDAATNAREAECKKRGQNCRIREDDERAANAAFSKASAEKAATKQAKDLDIEIAGLKARLEKAGPVLEANPQGSAFARLFSLPDSKAAFLSAWQNFAMGVIVEILIVFSMIAFEVLGRAEKSIAPLALSGRPDKAVDLESLPGSGEPFRAIPAASKPRLVASSLEPIGNVATIISTIMEPGTGRQKIEIAEIFKAYAQACRQQGKRPVSPEEFSGALQRLCESLAIKVSHKGGHVYLMKVWLKEIEASATR